MESLEAVVKGIAHDLNNVLTAASCHMSWARVHVDPGDMAALRLSDAENALSRARELARQLLFQAAPVPQLPTITSLEVLVRDASMLALSGSPADFDIAVTEDLWDVRVCRAGISRVIENLLINAARAMPGGGHVLVTLDNVDAGDECKHAISPGRYVRMTIYDTGCGISRTDMGRIFDPLFTTRGSGTGLGLAISRAIVANHQGSLFVESESGFGTTVFVYLPAEGTLAE